ncbi:unnamed protein product [Effrenium voratum]|uniref:GST N-terminal domain-containing protein n=1 Tax=Effrenium voratum TaxID=2562239 RepID=A0AA36IFQ6_9DINO|nr:unnamed protein product [Effrenium voratum]
MRSYGDKPKEFLALVPRGLLPAMELDGRVMTESLDIMFTIERTFPDPDKPMFPTDKALQKRASDLLNLERQLFGAWCSFLFRPEMPFIGGSEQDFTDTLQAVDAELGRSESPFFLPYPHPTIVDMQYVSHVERAVASAMFYKGYDIRKKFKNIDRWLSAYEELPHYMATKSDYYTHCMDIPPQYGPCFSNDSDLARRARELIEPKEASLPVQWQSDLEPPTELQRRSPEQDFRVEAALRLIENREAVTRFCCRGAGPDVGAWARGNPTKCQLADPYARPNLDLAPAVNAVLRVVSAALLQNDPAEVQGIKGHLAAEKLEADPKEVAKCIAYLRDRVGSPRDLSMPAAKLLRGHLAEAVRKESASSARSTRPKWRLCFRLDRRSASPKESLEDLAPKYQRDFFLTVIDPPCRGAFRQNPPAPFFASRAACHVADLLASRHMIAQLPGRSFEQKAVAVIGSECLAAGLVAATLGAKALFVCERSLEQYYQHNLRLFRRDTLDYTKTKSKILAVYPCSPGRTGGFDPEMANKLQAPSLDIIVLTEVSLARVAGEMGGIAGREAGFFRFLESLIPARSCTKALVVCDQSFAELMEEPRDRRGPRRTDEDVPAWLKGEGAPPGLAQVLPADWQARTFCQLPQGIPVVWLERQDAERVKRRAPPLVSRPPMPPMGASSSRCGCGGHLQSPLLGQRVENQEWFAKNAKLKEAHL